MHSSFSVLPVQAGHVADEAGVQHGVVAGVWRGAGTVRAGRPHRGKQVHRQGTQNIPGGMSFNIRKKQSSKEA